MSIKNSNDTIGNRTRDLPTCSAVPQPTALPRGPQLHSNNRVIKKNFLSLRRPEKFTIIFLYQCLPKYHLSYKTSRPFPSVILLDSSLEYEYGEFMERYTQRKRKYWQKALSHCCSTYQRFTCRQTRTRIRLAVVRGQRIPALATVESLKIQKEASSTFLSVLPMPVQHCLI